MTDPLNPGLDKEWEWNLSVHMISDLHGFYTQLPGGDLLIISGDHTSRDEPSQWYDFCDWIESLPYKQIIIISGNHDMALTPGLRRDGIISELERSIRVRYLCNSWTEWEGLKIWGCPYSLTFDRINPKCTAFTGDEAYLKSKYDLIPEGVDILISHGPPQGILDEVQRKGFDHESCIENVGSWELLYAMDRVKPKLLVTGHIHENGLQTCLYKHQGPNTMCVNASYVDAEYRPRNAFMACEWDGQNFVKFESVNVNY